MKKFQHIFCTGTFLSFKLSRYKKTDFNNEIGDDQTWWAIRDSNPRHPRCKRDALTN